LSSRAHPRYAGESPHYIDPKTKTDIKKMEERAKRPSPLFIFDHYLSQRCPDCGCFLKAAKGSKKKEWLTQCKHYHCWIVNIENGVEYKSLHKIPATDDRYPGRNRK